MGRAAFRLGGARYDGPHRQLAGVDFDLWERGDGPGGPPTSIRIPGVSPQEAAKLDPTAPGNAFR